MRLIEGTRVDLRLTEGTEAGLGIVAARYCCFAPAETVVFYGGDGFLSNTGLGEADLGGVGRLSDCVGTGEA